MISSSLDLVIQVRKETKAAIEILQYPFPDAFFDKCKMPEHEFDRMVVSGADKLQHVCLRFI